MTNFSSVGWSLKQYEHYKQKLPGKTVGASDELPDGKSSRIYNP